MEVVVLAGEVIGSVIIVVIPIILSLIIGLNIARSIICIRSLTKLSTFTLGCNS